MSSCDYAQGIAFIFDENPTEHKSVVSNTGGKLIGFPLIYEYKDFGGDNSLDYTFETYVLGNNEDQDAKECEWNVDEVVGMLDWNLLTLQSEAFSTFIYQCNDGDNSLDYSFETCVLEDNEDQDTKECEWNVDEVVGMLDWNLLTLQSEAFFTLDWSMFE